MSEVGISRRRFLRIAGVTLGASALACCGMGYAATRLVPAGWPEVTETPGYTYGGDNRALKRILVTYATRTGATIGVAAAIGEALAARGFRVDVRPAQEKPRLDGYAAAVLGSAINGGQWLPEAVAFAGEERTALARIPLALFCVHALNTGDDERSRNNRLAYLAAVRELVTPVEEAFFAGLGLNTEGSPAFTRGLNRALKFSVEGDARDWEKIRGWASALPARLGLA